MEVFAALSVSVLILTALFISIKTFGLWRRTRLLPELLLTLMLFTDTVVGYPLAVACHVIPPAEARALHIAYTTVFNGGLVFLLLFNQRVFRPNSGWAVGLVIFTALLNAACATAYIAEVLKPNPRSLNDLPVLWAVNSAAIAIPYFWTTIEALATRARLRRQLHLGLTNATVVDRTLLWALMGLSAGVAVIINLVGALTGAVGNPLIEATSSLLGLVHAGCLFLAFHPVGWYRRWVTSRYAAESA